MNITIGEYTVIETGTVIEIKNEPITFTIFDLTYKITFFDDPTNLERLVRYEPDGKKGMNIIMVNHNRADGVGNVEPAHIGTKGNLGVYFAYRAYSLIKGTGRTLHYTWYTKIIK